MAERVRVHSLAGVDVGGGAPTRVMAVINASPESFYPDSIALDTGALADVARRHVEEGADFVDIGAMSTAPYLETAISAEVEKERMVAAVEAVAEAVATPVSSDTSRASVALAALAAGARVVNDVNGLRGSGMAEVAARAEGVVVMASPDPASSNTSTVPLERVRSDLRDALRRASEAGVEASRIVIDPGIGFYTGEGVLPLEFNCGVLANLESLADLGFPILVGVSRKSFLGTVTGRSDPAERLAASLAATAIAVRNGASVVRTHDVAATRDAVRVVDAIRQHAD